MIRRPPRSTLFPTRRSSDLIGGVIVGTMTAKAIALVHGLKLSAVNHLEGHAFTARLTDDGAFPYLLLLVSGGHCQLLDRKSTRLNSSHQIISYAVFCLK